jgi:hypothetical protein
MAADPLLLSSVLIGINDIVHGCHDLSEVSEGVAAVVKFLLNNSQGAVLVSGLLQPLEKSTTKNVNICCGKWDMSCDWQTAGNISAVNALIRSSVYDLRKEFGAWRIAFADCGAVFTDSGVSGRHETRMADALHPNREGWEALFNECLQGELKQLESAVASHHGGAGGVVFRNTSAQQHAATPEAATPSAPQHEDSALPSPAAAGSSQGGGVTQAVWWLHTQSAAHPS